MKTTDAINRRHFLQAGLIGSTALVAAALPDNAAAALTKPEGDGLHGLKLGMASYTFRNFSLDQAIAMTKQAGVKYINLKDVHLSLKSTKEELQAAHKKIEDAGLTLMGGGNIGMKDNADEIRAVFEYARGSGMPVIVCTPEVAAFDKVEQMVKEFNQRIAIHNHGPESKQYPSPLDVFELVKKRDERMGLCMDVGHTVRVNVDPVAAIHDCASRLYDFHIKDESKAALGGGRNMPVAVGRGVIDIVGVLKAMVEIKFTGHVGLEYEAKADDPLPGAIESIAYIRGILAAI